MSSPDFLSLYLVDDKVAKEKTENDAMPSSDMQMIPEGGAFGGNVLHASCGGARSLVSVRVQDSGGCASE